MKNRYFIVTYSQVFKKGSWGFGDSALKTTNGKFFNREEFIEEIGRQNNAEKVIIGSILEVNYKDYKAYTQKKP